MELRPVLKWENFGEIFGGEKETSIEQQERKSLAGLPALCMVVLYVRLLELNLGASLRTSSKTSLRTILRTSLRRRMGD